MTAVAAQMDRVSLRLGARMVLNDVSFAVAEGAFVGLLGPNGAGKTTLLRALLGLVSPVAGAIAVLGSPARSRRPGIGYMPQRSQGAASFVTGHDFVASAVDGARVGVPWLSRAARHDVAEAIEAVGAAHVAPRAMEELSGGERQRLKLAQALLGRPRLLLLDEPLVGLDPPGQAEIVALVRDLQRRRGCTVLCSSHELNPILPAIDLVLYLAHSQAAIGSPEQVITAPVLSRLYGAPIEVIRAAGRVFVVQGETVAAAPTERLRA